MNARRAWGAWLIGACVLTVSSPTWADIPPPPADLPQGKQSDPLVVRVDPTKDVSFLKLPRRALERAGLQVPARDARSDGPSRFRSVVAAGALSLGVASVLLLRGRRWRAAAAAALVAVGAVLASAWATADVVPPPGQAAPLTNLSLSGEVVIEVVDEGPVEMVLGMKPLPKRKPLRPPPPLDE